MLTLPFYLVGLYSRFIKDYTVGRHKICVRLHCFDSKYARYISPSRTAAIFRALPGTNFMPSGSSASKKKNFFIFKADQEGVTYEYAD